MYRPACGLVFLHVVAASWPQSYYDGAGAWPYPSYVDDHPGSICPKLVSAEQKEELPIINPRRIDPSLLMVCDDMLTPDDIYTGLMSVLVKIENTLRNRGCDPRAVAIHKYPTAVHTLLGQLRHVSPSSMQRHPVLGTYLDTMATRTRQLIAAANNCQLDYVLLMKIIRMSMKLLVNRVMCGIVEADVLRRRLLAARDCSCHDHPAYCDYPAHPAYRDYPAYPDSPLGDSPLGDSPLGDSPIYPSRPKAPLPWRPPLRDWQTIVPPHWHAPPEASPLTDDDLPWNHPDYYRAPRWPYHPPQYRSPRSLLDPVPDPNAPFQAPGSHPPPSPPWDHHPAYYGPPPVPREWPYYPPQYSPTSNLIGPVYPDGSPVAGPRPPVCEDCEREKNVIAANL